MASLKIEQDVLVVLSAMTVQGNLAVINSGTLDRKLYVRVNKVLETLGGKWDKKLKGHFFAEGPTEVLDRAIVAGEVTQERDLLGWFPTPPDLVHALLDAAKIEPGMTLLEPSAGEGAIAYRAADRGALVTTVEISQPRYATLHRGKGQRPVQGQCTDFMEWAWGHNFDRVVMNPPFAKQQDIDHVLHAWDFLKPGGILVSVMSAGVAFRQDAKSVKFRELVADHNGSITANKDGAFKPSGTDVRTVTVVLYRHDPLDF